MPAVDCRSVALPGSFRSMTIPGGIAAVAARNPDKVSLIQGDRTRTYGHLVERAARIANATLRDLRLPKGSNAAIVARNCIEYIELVCGLPLAGVAVATVNNRYTTAEIEGVIDDAQAKVVFVDASTVDAVRAARLPGVQRIIQIGPEYEAWLERGRKPTDWPAIDEWDTWTIPYTSGTTGKPKGVQLPHRSRALVGYGSAAEFGCFSPDDRFLAMTPMNHGGGLGFPIAALLMGGSIDIMEKFDAEAVLHKFKFAGITGVFMVPTHFHQIFALDPAILERYRRPPLKAIISNAAPLPQAMKERIVPYFGEGVLFEIYSSTEAGLVCSLRPQDQLRKLSCAGQPQAFVKVRIANEAGDECAPGEVGELFSSSPMLFKSYWNRPEETRAAFRGEWMSVGDLAMRDEHGYIYIVDRKKDMVISGGVNIYPREIEEVLLTHVSVADAAVIGVPDEKWGERLLAFIVPRVGLVPDSDEMSHFLSSRLASYKVPREYRVIEALPRNANGKVLKTELRRVT